MFFRRRYELLLLLFFLVAYILPLGWRPLLEPDETRYAEIPREMIASGEWIVPHLNGLRYFEKPPLGYWVHAGSLLLFGQTNFAVRLPSALSVGLSALLIFYLISRARRPEDPKDNGPALAAVLVFLSNFGVFGVGNVAVLDSLFSFFLTAAIAAFFFASEEPSGSGKERIFLTLSGFSCGLAFLTKGFLAFAVPVLVLVPYLIWERRYRDLFRMSRLPVFVALLVAMPWAALIHWKEPDFWRFFFWNEHVRRFWADNAQHGESFWFFILTAPGMFIPWTFLIPASITGIRKTLYISGATGRLLKLSVCWLVVPFLFFSFSHGKLLTYILPCFPPAAVLMGFGLTEALRKERGNTLFQSGAAFTVVFLGVAWMVFLLLHHFGYPGFHLYEKPWKMIMVANGMIFLILFVMGAFKSNALMNKVLLFGMAPLLLFVIFHFAVPDTIIKSKAPVAFFELHEKEIGADEVVIADEDALKSVCWHWRRNDVKIIGAPGELDYGLAYDDAAERRLGVESAHFLIDKNRGKVVFVSRAGNFLQWQKQLPRPHGLFQSGPSGYVLARY